MHLNRSILNTHVGKCFIMKVLKGGGGGGGRGGQAINLKCSLVEATYSMGSGNSQIEIISLYLGEEN